jgi:hypothetical protein
VRAPCLHGPVDYWFNALPSPWRCGLCKEPYLDPQTCAEHEAAQHSARIEDEKACGGVLDGIQLKPTSAAATHAASLHACAVSVEWLQGFADAHDCYDWPTWRVQRDIIRPACAARRCRYVELPAVAPHAGPADVFISHCWGAKFGIVVAAAICAARKKRLVWIDLFAVRQFPGNEADLDFAGVVR